MFSKIASTVCLLFELIFVVQSVNYTGKSYYFKTNANNEFTVYNKIHFLNHNITDFDVNPHAPQNVRVIKKVNGVTVSKPPHLNHHISGPQYLDPEWHYDHKTANKSDLPYFIKKFYEHRLEEPENTHTVRILFNVNNNSSDKIIQFNLHSLNPYENVTDADLYFYWPLENTSSIYRTSVVLRLYQFEKQFNNELNESNLMENPDVHKLFNVIYISKAQKGWQTFKIKKPIDNWAKGEENLGLLLTISDYDENKLITIYNDTNQGVFRTFAVLNIESNGTSPIKNTTDSDRPENLEQPHAFNLPQRCLKKPWQVDFKQLHWNDFIIYPENGFAAYQCTGKCHIEEENRNSINYLKLRHWNNGHGLREKSCCVPTEFSSLPIMFMDRFHNVVMKNYEDMIVEQCGCR